YQYRYDGKNRLVLKKLPGKGWEYMVYDKADRVIMSQDALMGGNKQWLFTKYDSFGRVAYTGIYTSTQDYGPAGRAAEQVLADALLVNKVTRTSAVSFTQNGMSVYYDNTASSYPQTITQLLSVNYYDTYPGYDFTPTFPGDILGEPTLSQESNTTVEGISTKGLPLVNLLKNVENDNWTKNFNYYDRKGRIIGTHSINYLGGYTRTESQLDFAGVPLKINTTHLKSTGVQAVTIKERFVYDPQNRIKQYYHQVDSNPEELLADNTYNELSQLSNKKVGNNLQSMDYAYNIRGWLTDINKDDMTVPNLGGKLFAYKIKYNQREGITNPDPALFSGKNVEAKFNGNITEVDWRAVENVGVNPPLMPKRYGYVYDKLNRLTAGYYQNPQNPNSKENTESIDYDVNGNITNLYRTSLVETGTTATVIDRLRYSYAAGGNKLTSIIDDQQNATGYEGGGNTITYDLNGNMTNMKDKNIGKISYNFLNLLNKIENVNATIPTMSYLYRADGIKLQKTYMSTECGFAGCYMVPIYTDYLDGFQYVNKGNPIGGGSSESFALSQETDKAMEIQAFNTDISIRKVMDSGLRFFPTAEGFYDYGLKKYIYQYKDHLGNVRKSFLRNSEGALEITDSNDYYPFGMNHLNTGSAFFGRDTYQSYKYNGKELQESGMYDYGARMYMPDIGRWSVVDLLSEKGHNFSPYNYAINNPIRFIDPDGLWINITDGQNQYRYSNGQTQHQVDGKWKVIDSSTNLSNNVIGIVAGLQALENGGDTGKGLVSYFDNPEHDVSLVYEKGSMDAGTEISDPIKLDPNMSRKLPQTNGFKESPFFVNLGHEMGHKMDPNKYILFGSWTDPTISASEIYASHIENKIRAENGLPLRVSYGINLKNKVANGVDPKTILIDSAGNSVYYNSYGRNILFDMRSGDPFNAYLDCIGCGKPLTNRFNYYNNAKKQKK
ncbi:MAG: RHS repeat-associated core domain-containing protein, partial [Chryseobacterium sp.]|uniref:RHS repeat-associated core domain-containing protein n=1 Tax=Chryseobacterium sp. TaxID=1871047 RepID=UPI003D1382D4